MLNKKYHVTDTSSLFVDVQIVVSAFRENRSCSSPVSNCISCCVHGTVSTNKNWI